MTAKTTSRGAHHNRNRVLCRVCKTEIEWCKGRFGMWMHSETRRERADDGHLAMPVYLEVNA